MALWVRVGFAQLKPRRWRWPSPCGGPSSPLPNHLSAPAVQGFELLFGWLQGCHFQNTPLRVSLPGITLLQQGAAGVLQVWWSRSLPPQLCAQG